MADQRRKSERVVSELPLSIEGGPAGITRNMSPSGVYFVVDGQPEKSQEVRFTIDFAGQAGSASRLQLNCIGKVVRVEAAEGKWGVAVSITEASLETVPKSS